MACACVFSWKTDAHEAALGIMERQLATGQRPAGSEHQLRMLDCAGAAGRGRKGRGRRALQPLAQPVTRRAFRNQPCGGPC